MFSQLICCILFSSPVKYSLCCYIELITWPCFSLGSALDCETSPPYACQQKDFCWYQMCAWSGLGHTRASAIQSVLSEIMKWCQVLRLCKVTQVYKSHYVAQQHHSRQWNTEVWSSKSVFWHFCSTTPNSSITHCGSCTKAFVSQCADPWFHNILTS